MTDRYKEAIQGARDCVERNKDGGVYLPDLLVVIDSQQAEIERLKAKCENTQIGYNFAKVESKELRKEKYKLQKALNQAEDYRLIAKAEAIKEFTERLHTEINRVTGDIIQERNERLDEIESSDIVIPFDDVLNGYNSKLQAYDHINGFIHLQYKEMVGDDK